MAFHAFHTLSFPWPVFRFRPILACQPHGPKPKGFHVELANLNLTEVDLVKGFSHQLQAQILEAEDFADEDRLCAS